MKNVKKWTALVLCFAMLAAVSACGKQKENPDLLTDEIAPITGTAEAETTMETTTETTTTAASDAVLFGSEMTTTTNLSGTQAPTVAATAPPASAATTVRTLPPTTAAPKTTTTAPKATTAAATAAATTAPPAPSIATTRAAAPAATTALTVAPFPGAATQQAAPSASEVPLITLAPDGVSEAPLIQPDSTAAVLPVPLETQAQGDPNTPPMPNLSLNRLDETTNKLTIGGTDLLIGGNVDAFISVNPPVSQYVDPNPRFINGQQVSCISYSYADYVVWCNAADRTVIGIDLNGTSNSPITTAKGIHVGSTIDEVTAAYGTDYTASGLQITFSNGIVSMISIGG